jgi:type I restriction enzyme M protein
LNDANLLYKVVQKFAPLISTPKAVSNHDMGLVFEELIRRFAEGSNETAGEHFTPRDIVRLTTSLVFMEDDEALTKSGIIRTIYDPTAGTGGFLSAGMEYVHELNPNAVMRAYGQELNPESYAICKADMLIKGQEVGNIKLGNTLSNDQLHATKFDYMLSNPPFGVDWKKLKTISLGNIQRKALTDASGLVCQGFPMALYCSCCTSSANCVMPKMVVVASALFSMARLCSQAVRVPVNQKFVATF